MSKTSETGNRCESSVKVGILHSLSGTMAIGEASLKDAALMAIAEINAAGGVLGKPIEPVIEDGASSPTEFALQARKLIQQEQVVTIFGGWSSASRKAVLPVLEEFNAQLWYPVEYEGLESSPHIFYTGICPNQQVEPALTWAIANKGKRIYLIGSNYVFPRTINKIIRAHLKQQGGEIVGEEYILLGEQDFRDIIPRIQASQADLVFNTLNGDSNIAFYHQYREAGITSAELPILAVSVAEDEVRRIGEAATGHYATWSYFQSVNTPQNQKFVKNFQARYGKSRVTSDPIEAAYTQVYLWKQSVEKAGTFDVDPVRKAAYNQTFEAPGGLVRIEANNHICKTCRIGEILPNGQFKIVWETPDAIAPLPWLGIETMSGSVSAVAIEMLGEVSQAIQYSCQMEEKSRQLEMAMAEVKATNERLESTQAELVASETRFRELRSRVELLKRRLSSQIHTSLNIDTILKTAVSEIRNLLAIDRCQFLWYNTDSHPPNYEQSQEARDPKQPQDCTDNPLAEIPALGKALQQLQLLQIDDAIADRQLDPPSRDLLQASSIRSLLAVAVQTHSGQKGALVCLHGSSTHPWTESEVELLQDVAIQIAIAIDQAKLYDQSCITATAANAQAAKLKTALHELKQTQAKLIQTEKISSLGSLVAGVAHEINNPVNFIYGNLSYATKYLQELMQLLGLYEKYYGEPPEEIRAYREEIELDYLLEDLPQMISSMRVGAERIGELARSLRNFSRADTGELKVTDIHEGLKSTLLILHHRLKANPYCGAIATIEQFGDLPPVECYPSQLNQVFMNAIGNAIDALEEMTGKWNTSNAADGNGHHLEPGDRQRKRTGGGSGEMSLSNLDFSQSPLPVYQLPLPTIWIRTEVVRDEAVAIRVADNGPGMTPEVRQQLFEAFFTTKPEGKGTGLGLSISYQIVVERHGGSISCISEPGQGTEFRIVIPIRQGGKVRSADPAVDVIPSLMGGAS